MKKTKFTETQIVAILKQQENGIPTKEICRQNGISEATAPAARFLQLEQGRLSEASMAAWNHPMSNA